MASVVKGVVGVFVKPAVNFCLPDGVDVSTAVNKKKVVVNIVRQFEQEGLID